MSLLWCVQDSLAMVFSFILFYLCWEIQLDGDSKANTSDCSTWGSGFARGKEGKEKKKKDFGDKSWYKRGKGERYQIIKSVDLPCQMLFPTF